MGNYGNWSNIGKKFIKDFDQKKEDCKIYGGSHNDNYWHLIVEYFYYHKIGHILINCPSNKKKINLTSSNTLKISENLNSKGKAKKMNCFSEKIASKD